jgi:plasmid stability protein
MAQLLVRDLDEALVRKIKKAASAHHRSVAGEVRLALERSFLRPANRRAALARIRALSARVQPDPEGLSAADLVRQVREGS